MTGGPPKSFAFDLPNVAGILLDAVLEGIEGEPAKAALLAYAGACQGTDVGACLEAALVEASDDPPEDAAAGYWVRAQALVTAAWPKWWPADSVGTPREHRRSPSVAIKTVARMLEQWEPTDWTEVERFCREELDGGIERLAGSLNIWRGGAREDATETSIPTNGGRVGLRGTLGWLDDPWSMRHILAEQKEAHDRERAGVEPASPETITLPAAERGTHHVTIETPDGRTLDIHGAAVAERAGGRGWAVAGATLPAGTVHLNDALPYQSIGLDHLAAGEYWCPGCGESGPENGPCACEDED